MKLGQRYYDPSLGRFTQLDPLGGGYVYADDDPINGTDPTGLQIFSTSPAPTPGSISSTPINFNGFGGSGSGGISLSTNTPSTLASSSLGGVTGDVGGISTAKKPDIQFIDYLVQKYGLTPDQRRQLHDAITGQNYSEEEIEQIAQDIANMGGGGEGNNKMGIGLY